jgi:hypothetical protein
MANRLSALLIGTFPGSGKSWGLFDERTNQNSHAPARVGADHCRERRTTRAVAAVEVGLGREH